MQSKDFYKFMKEFKFEKQPSSPYYPQSNGLAERAVQTAKSLLIKCLNDGSSIELALLNFRNTSRNSKLQLPNQRLLSRITRSSLPVNKCMLKPKIVEEVQQQLKIGREKQKLYFDKASRSYRDKFHVGDKVLVQNPLNKIWSKGVIYKLTPYYRSVIVMMENGKQYRRSTVLRIKEVPIVPVIYHKEESSSDSKYSACYV